MSTPAISGDRRLYDLLHELQRVDALVRARASDLQRSNALEDTYRGLYISDSEFQSLLDRPFGLNPLSQPTQPATLVSDQDSAWQRIKQVLYLSDLEADILLICLLPEIDEKYGRVFAYLQDDITRKCPTVNLVLALLCPTLVDRLAGRALFTDDAPLLRQRILLRSLPGDTDLPLLNHCLQVEPYLASWLLAVVPGSLPPHLAFVDQPNIPVALDIEAETADEWQSLVYTSPDDGPWLHIIADEWSARRAVQALGAAWQMPMICCAWEPALALSEQCTRAALARREALLHYAGLYIRLAAAEHDEQQAAVESWADALDGHPLPVIWSSASPAELPWPTKSAHVARLHCQRLGYAGRLAVWEQALGAALRSPTVDLAELAGRYRLRGDQIHQAAQAAQHAAWQRCSAAPVVESSDLFAAARAASSSHLGQLARRVEPQHSWSDLILPSDRLAQLHEMCNQFKYRHIVFDRWGFNQYAARGRGLSALFTGLSGTGKTMAAEVIAGELGLDLFKIDLAGIVSKYIGETEKNLERIFGQAEDSNAILFFDEADALFGKRSETKDAHDRYANIEISYLLQKIEEYDGVVILTSNLRQNMDEAFLRRLQFAIEFPFPDASARLQIWQRAWPAAMPTAPDVDLMNLAERYKFSGGSIRNVLQTAAFLAASDGGCVTMGHLLRAARREFQKLGKLVDEAQFAAQGELAGASEE